MRRAVKLACVVTGAIALMTLGYGVWTKLASDDQDQRVFYGKVIDQEGTPVPDAEIVVQIAALVHNPVMVGGLIEDPFNRSRFRVRSNSAGEFLVPIPHRFEQLSIEAVTVPDHDWVIDWAWTLGPPHNKDDNRLFTFSSERFRHDVYLPQRDRPAVFPVHRKGSESPATRPSRGGAQVHWNGSVVENHPHSLRVPSAGLGAPVGEAATDRAIQDY